MKHKTESKKPYENLLFPVRRFFKERQLPAPTSHYPVDTGIMAVR